MDKFIMKKSTEANIYKSIRFPAEINDQINNIVNNFAIILIGRKSFYWNTKFHLFRW